MGLNAISCEENNKNDAAYATKPGRGAYAASDFNGGMGALKSAALLAVGGAAGAVFGYAVKGCETGNCAASVGVRFAKYRDNKVPYGGDELQYSGAAFKTLGTKFTEVAKDAAFDPDGGGSPAHYDAMVDEVDLTATDLISELFRSAVTAKRA